MDERVQIDVERRIPGRMLLATPDALYLGRGYDIHRSRDGGASFEPLASMPTALHRRAARVSRLASRLLRQEVRALACLADGTLVGANRQGVFRSEPGESLMRRCAVDAGDLALMPPMRLTVGPAQELVWGEYGCPGEPRPVRLFASRDAGRRFRQIHEFASGDIYHIHNLIWDAGRDHYWVLAGDHGEQAGIGRLSRDLERFEWYVRGQQRYRVVGLFDFGDRLVYATDSELEPNGLVSLDKDGGKSEKLRDFEGSCIYACQYGGLYAITTTVEPGVNPSRDATLWVSRDGEKWKCAFRAPKDRWHADYFQFGSVILPTGRTDSETLLFSGQAVTGLDGKTAVARLQAGAEF